ncbi:MAG: hypothetical protein SH808_09760 [Saprospiraceae bacterium]|nr:hypothetical protein [Saprospiraceae bacterium]
MTKRLSQWFTIIPPVSAQGMASAVYNGEYQGVPDPIGQGRVGATYQVKVLSATKLEAPIPPFTEDENFDV